MHDSSDLVTWEEVEIVGCDHGWDGEMTDNGITVCPVMVRDGCPLEGETLLVGDDDMRPVRPVVVDWGLGHVKRDMG